MSKTIFILFMLVVNPLLRGQEVNSISSDILANQINSRSFIFTLPKVVEPNTGITFDKIIVGLRFEVRASDLRLQTSPKLSLQVANVKVAFSLSSTTNLFHNGTLQANGTAAFTLAHTEGTDRLDAMDFKLENLHIKELPGWGTKLTTIINKKLQGPDVRERLMRDLAKKLNDALLAARKS